VNWVGNETHDAEACVAEIADTPDSKAKAMKRCAPFFEKKQVHRRWRIQRHHERLVVNGNVDFR
jgi:hypothetical protein